LGWQHGSLKQRPDSALLLHFWVSLHACGAWHTEQVRQPALVLGMAQAQGGPALPRCCMLSCARPLSGPCRNDVKQIWCTVLIALQCLLPASSNVVGRVTLQHKHIPVCQTCWCQQAACCCGVPCSVEVQLVGDRKNTRVEQRILHLDIAAAALKLVRSTCTHIALSAARAPWC
jgi:hypothetical protein